MLTICLLILVGLYLKQPVEALAEKLKTIDWHSKFNSLWQYIFPYAKNAGRIAARPILLFYHVVTDSETTTMEKAMIYGCIAYVVLPFSILPRAVYKVLGIMDEAAAILYVYNKIQHKITPKINSRVQETLDSWFGSGFVVTDQTYQA